MKSYIRVLTRARVGEGHVLTGLPGEARTKGGQSGGRFEEIRVVRWTLVETVLEKIMLRLLASLSSTTKDLSPRIVKSQCLL